MRLKLSINGKMLLYILSTTVIVYVSALSYIAIKLRQNSYKQAINTLESYAVEKSNIAKQQIDKYMDEAILLSLVYSNFHNIPDSVRTKQFSMIAYNTIKKNPDYVSIWVRCDSSVVENLTDSLNIKYSCSYIKNGDDIIANENNLEDSIINLRNDIYNKVKSSGKIKISEPYKIKSGIGSTLVSTMVVPIFDNISNTFLGVVAIDAPMDYIQQTFSAMRPMETGRTYLLTNKGYFFAHPEDKFLGKCIDEYAPEIDKEFNIKSLISKGEEKIISTTEPATGSKSIFILKRVNINGINTPWTYCVSVPIDKTYKSANTSFRFALIIGVIGLIIISLILLGIAYSISTPIIKVTNALQKISKGEINDVEKLNLLINDEISDMAKNMNKLVDGLKRAATFAQQIGNGELNKSYKLLSNSDVLGTSLISMQESLKKAKEAEEKKKIEDEKRNWVTHGLAKFGDIIRQHNDNMDKFTYNIAVNIAEYMNVAQVAIYIHQQEDENINQNDTYELKVAIAYGKQVMLTKTFEKGQELLGRAVEENKIIYLQNIPERYVILSPGMKEKKRPQNLLIIPLHVNEIVLGAIEILSYNTFEPHEIEFMEKLSENIASVVSSVKTNLKTEQLLKQSQYQADELAQHEEEMRQNLEEMQATQEEANNRQEELNAYLDSVKKAFMIAVLDYEGKIIDITSSMSAMYGASTENMRGKYFDAFIAKDKKEQDEFKEFMQNIIQTGSGKRKQIFVNRNKETVILESYILVKSENMSDKILVFAIDKTRERELNMKLIREAEQKGIDISKIQ